MTPLEQNIQLNKQNGALLETVRVLQEALNRKNGVINTQKQTISELIDKKNIYRDNCLEWKAKHDSLHSNITQLYRSAYNA